MASRPRLTNNSVASLDEQTAVLDTIFDKEEPNKSKDKDKVKAKKRKLTKTIPDKKKQKVSQEKQVPAAALGGPVFEPDLGSDMELDDSESLTWSEAQRKVGHDQQFEFQGEDNFSEHYDQDWVDDGSHSIDIPQHGSVHALSEEESEVGSIVSVQESIGNKPTQAKVLEEITAKGALADFLREQLAEVKECDKVTPKLSGGVARIVDKYLTDSIYTADMEKLAKKYPKVENVSKMDVPKLDTEVFTVVQQHFRNTDQSFQTIQKGVVSSLAALSPVLEKVLVKSEEDPELAALGINIADSMKLMSFTLNLLSGRRRELLKPCLAPAYVRVLTKGHETTPQWLFGGDLLTTTKRCEAAKRIGQKVLKPKETSSQPRGRRDNQRRFRAPFQQVQQNQQGMLRAFNPYQQYQHGRFPAPQSFQQQGYPYQPLETGVPTGFPRPYRPRYPNQQGQQQQAQGLGFPKKVK